MGRHIQKLESEFVVECIFRDAATIGFRKAAAKHSISKDTAYNLLHQYPDVWQRIKMEMRSLIEAETREMWRLSTNLLIQQLEAKGALKVFKPIELAKIIQTCGIQFERHLRMDGVLPSLAEQVEALREAVTKGHQDGLDVIKKLAGKLSLEEIDDIAEHMRKTGCEGEVGPESGED